MNIVTCVVINFETPEQAKGLVDKLHDSDFSVILVENSPATTPQDLKVESQDYRYIANRANIGFGAAANKGAKEAKTEWLLFLNPDVEITPDAIKNFVKRAEDAKLDACCPKTSDMRYTHPLPSLWWFLGTYTPLYRIPLFMTQARKYPVTLWGGCLLIRREVFEKLGGFDERFFLWFEDSDLTKRLIDGGYRVGQLPVDGLRHEGGASFHTLSETEKRKLFFQSAYTYVTIHGSWLDRLVVRLLQLRFR
jgi:GT2 family glycosyltransferase